MSLEQALAANTEAVNRLCALMQGANITTNPAAPVIQQPMTQTFPPPAAPAPPTAMPAAPFPGMGAPQAPSAPAAPNGLPPRPFNDATGLLDWAMAHYKARQAVDATTVDRITAVIRNHGLDQAGIGAARPDQLDSLYVAIAAI